MYGYQDTPDRISPRQILQKVTEEQIFEAVFGEAILIDSKRYLSPFRQDNRPGAYFSVAPESGKLLFLDFGDSKTHRDCFDAVMDRFGVSFGQAIEMICDKFNLSKSLKDYKFEPVSIREITEDKNLDVTITYKSRPYYKPDIFFWTRSLITLDNLKEDNVHAVESAIIVNPKKNKRSTLRPRMCYAIDFIDAVKLYQPNSVDFKWITNCNENHIGNIDNLPKTGKSLIIQKSYKDHRVIRNLVPEHSVIWFHNEGCQPDEVILKDLASRFESISVFFDNDNRGSEASQLIVNMMKPYNNNTRSISLPKLDKHQYLFGRFLKDPGDWVNREGRNTTLEALKLIGL